MSWNTGTGEHFIASNPPSNVYQPFSFMAATGEQTKLEPTVVAYFPAGAATYTHTGDTLFAVVDAVNLVATLVVPPSGRLFVELSAAAFVSAGLHRWGLADANGNLTESQQVIANDAVKKRYTAEMVITKDSAGVALVPGAAITLKWTFQVDNGANTATIAYGGAGTATPDGPAVMRITPMSNRLTSRPFTTALTNGPLNDSAHSVIPHDMWTDRKQLVGYCPVEGRMYSSLDEGTTWLFANSSAIAGLAADAGALTFSARFMYDGEILVNNGTSATHPGRLYRSSGWQTNPATATFSLVLTASGAVNAADNYFDLEWGISVYGKIVVVNEYGPKASPTDMARYSYLSTDGGVTWVTIFDLFLQSGVGANSHMHGCAYDPWWDAIWLVNGDYTEPNTKVWVSFDHGATWKAVYGKHQYTTVIALPNCILFGTDEGSGASDGFGNGIHRINRQSKDMLAMEQAVVISSAGGAQYVVTATSRRCAFAPDAPAIFAFTSGTGADQLWMTYDGYTFQQTWLGAVQAGGVSDSLGPTASGLVWCRWTSGATQKALKVTPA